MHGDPWLKVAMGLTLAEQGVAGIDHQVDQHLLKLIDVTAHLNLKASLFDSQLDAFAAQAFGQ